MKPGIHPDYRYVVFQDTSSGDTFLTKSTIETSESTTWTDGNEYPLAKVEISAFTHPFFTGQMKIVDTAGRVERFERRYGRRKGKAADAPESADTEG
jgi:large subunit ribosomal protein L31